MVIRVRTLKALLITAGIALVSGSTTLAQDKEAGVVTTLQGTATVTRAAYSEPRRLALKDHVLVHDHVVTGDDSVVRILLGGKALVTVREHSALTIIEAPSTSTLRLASGRIAVAVVKEKMRPGESVEIRTPTAIAAIRGTVVIAEVVWPASVATAAVRSTITVLRGLVEVIQLDPVTQRPVGISELVSARGSVEVSGSARRSRTLSPAAAKKLADDYSLDMKVQAPSVTPGIVRDQLKSATEHVDAIVGAATPTPERPAAAPKPEDSQATPGARIEPPTAVRAAASAPQPAGAALPPAGVGSPVGGVNPTVAVGGIGSPVDAVDPAVGGIGSPVDSVTPAVGDTNSLVTPGKANPPSGVTPGAGKVGTVPTTPGRTRR